MSQPFNDFGSKSLSSLFEHYLDCVPSEAIGKTAVIKCPIRRASSVYSLVEGYIETVTDSLLVIRRTDLGNLVYYNSDYPQMITYTVGDFLRGDYRLLLI